ncbi:MAG: hypothetical protein WBX11_17540 [Thiobacillaceae bacterium]
MTQTYRISVYRRMAVAVIAVAAVASGLPVQAQDRRGGGHEQPAYQGGYRGGHGDNRGGHGGYRGGHGGYRGGGGDNRDGGGDDHGGLLIGALLGAFVGAALVGAQSPPAVVYSAPPPPPPPGVDYYYPNSYPPGY